MDSFYEFFEPIVCVEYLEEIGDHLECLYGLANNYIYRKYVANTATSMTAAQSPEPALVYYTNNGKYEMAHKTPLPPEQIRQNKITTNQPLFKAVILMVCDTHGHTPLVQYDVFQNFYYWSSQIASHFVLQKKPIDKDICLWYDYDFLETSKFRENSRVTNLCRNETVLFKKNSTSYR